MRNGALEQDYLRDGLLIGLRETPGITVVDVPRLDWLYTDFSPERKKHIYGRGFTYARVLGQEPHEIMHTREHWMEALAAKIFDHVIFSMQGNRYPWLTIINAPRPEPWDIARSAGYSGDEISFLHGSDYPFSVDRYNQLPAMLQHAHIFTREGFCTESCFERSQPYIGPWGKSK